MRLLTSFFNKSKPLHLWMLSGLAFLYYWLANFHEGVQPGFVNILKEIGFFLVFLMCIGLLNFIAKRNQITQKNSFAVLLFVLFAICFPEIFKSGETICAGFFVLLALRRLFSLKSGIAIKKKIFDASLWISTSTLFVDSALLFLLLVFFAVLLYAANDYRNWIIPLIGVLTVFVLYLTFHLLVFDDFSGLLSFFEYPNFDFFEYGEIPMLIPLSLFLAFMLWSLGDYLYIYKKTPGSAKTTMALVVGSLAIAVLVVIFSPTKNFAELFFLIIPVSLVGAHFFQRKKDLLFKEILLLAIMVMALVFPFLV